MTAETDTCHFCGGDLEDGGFPVPDGRVFCSPKHAAMDDSVGVEHTDDSDADAQESNDAEQNAQDQAALPGTVAAAGQDVPGADADREHPEPPKSPPQDAVEPDVPDTNPGVDAGSSGSAVTDPSEWDTTPAISDIDPSSTAVDTSGWPAPSIDGYHVPASLAERDLWLLWSPEFGKTPMAPWVTGHMYPVSWGQDADERPETNYDQAKMVAEMDPERIHDSYSFPPKDDEDEPHIPETLLPTVFMPHDPPEPPIMLVDFDDVRDPETGAITPEAMAIIRRLDSYAEVSSSGTGVHVYVRAHLPGALGKFIGDLDMVGHIEMYDHGRFVGATWDHLEGTPLDLRECQDDVDHLVERYEDEVQRQRRQGNPRAGFGSSPEAKKAQAELDAIRGDFDDDGDSAASSSQSATSATSSQSATSASSSGSRENAYFHMLDIEEVAREGRYGSDYFSYRESQREWMNGPHPAHGPQHSDIQECTNFGIKNDGWSCFFHSGGGGGAFSLLAVVSGDVDCDESGEVYDDPREMLKTCLLARDLEPRLEEHDPPYQALVGVAQQFGLAMADPDENILGETAWGTARKIYVEMAPADVE